MTGSPATLRLGSARGPHDKVADLDHGEGERMSAAVTDLFRDQLNQERFGPLDPDEVRIMGILQTHRGASDPITCADLSALVNIPERPLREKISLLRLHHGAKIGMAGHGYFMEQTAEEFESTNRNLEHRSLRMLAIVSRRRKMHLADLVGQLHLYIQQKGEAQVLKEIENAGE